MIKLIIFLLACSFSLYSAQTSLKEKLAQAQIGDFIVTAQEGNYSVLSVRSLTKDNLVLEEISIPSKQIDLKQINWKEWVKNRALGHSSWTLLEIDLQTGNLIECFSVSKNAWLYLDQSEQFLTRLLSLPLQSISQNERKKIGPQPLNGEPDRRSCWNPPLIVEGKKQDKAKFDVMRTQWPDDGTQLARCTIELYFATHSHAFAFPYWLEVQSPHYAFKMRIIDSGRGLTSSLQGPIPHRTARFLGTAQKAENAWTLRVNAPSYISKMHLFVLDVSDKTKPMLPVRCSTKKGQKEEIAFEIPTAELKMLLTPGNRYQWILVPEGNSLFVESDEMFVWAEKFGP